MRIDFEFMWTTLLNLITYIPVTLKLMVGALVIALPLSIVFAFITYKKVPVLNQISRVAISFIRGTPIILHLYVLYNLAPRVLNWYFTYIGSDIKVWDINNIYYAFIALSLYPIVALSEAFRSALLTVDPGQLEAAETVGLSKIQAYIRIIIPQAVVSAIPLMCNISVDLLKTTSLAFTMMVVEITGQAKILAGLSYSYVEAYLDIFFIYIFLVIILEKIFKVVEIKASKYKNA